MIYFIKKTVNEQSEVIIESQYFESIVKSLEAIDSGNSIAPDYIISNSAKMFDISYKNATLIVTEDLKLNVVADIVIHGISRNDKSDDFVISTIKEIHSDKIKAIANNKKTISSVDMTNLIDECRDKCLNAYSSGIAVNKKIVMEFLELKSTLGLNNQNNGAIQN